SIWTDLRGASTRDGHPAPFPIELAERLIRLFSFAGDTVLDPFVGTGSTSIAAVRAGRNSVGVEVEDKYLEMAAARLSAACDEERINGATEAVLEVERLPAASRIP